MDGDQIRWGNCCLSQPSSENENQEEVDGEIYIKGLVHRILVSLKFAGQPGTYGKS